MSKNKGGANKTTPKNDTPATENTTPEVKAAETSAGETPAAEGETPEVKAPETPAGETPTAEGETPEVKAAETSADETPAAEGDSPEANEAEKAGNDIHDALLEQLKAAAEECLAYYPKEDTLFICADKTPFLSREKSSCRNYAQGKKLAWYEYNKTENTLTEQ